jgi:hypothetical protein
MSISRKSSFETIVEKGRDPLQFLANPEHIRDELDLKGLSDSARKSFATLKLWQQATGWCVFYLVLLLTGVLIRIDSFEHHLVQTIINKIVEQGDKCHSVITKTLTNAQQGHAFAENVVQFCAALAEKHDTPEHLNQLLLSLIKVTEKARRRSIKAQDQLKDVRDGLSEVNSEMLNARAEHKPHIFCHQISKDMKVQVSKIEGDALIAPDLENDTPFNGVNTCFVTLPKNVAAVPAPTWHQPNIFPDTDSDDEDAVVGGVPSAWSPWGKHNSPDSPLFACLRIRLTILLCSLQNQTHDIRKCRRPTDAYHPGCLVFRRAF